MKLPHSPLLLPVCLFTIGASLHRLLPFSLSGLFICGIVLLGFLVFLYFFKILPKLQLALLYFGFFLLGIIYFKTYYQPFKTHYLNEYGTAKKMKEIKLVHTLSSTSFSNNYIGKLIRSGGQAASGKLLIRQAKDSLTKAWPIGTRFLTSQESKPLRGPLNPGQFSYKEYLINQP